MTIARLKLRHLEVALSKYEMQRQSMDQFIQQHSDFEVFVQHHPSDGHLVMSDIGKNLPVGMPLTNVLSIIEKGDRLTIKNWEPIG